MNEQELRLTRKLISVAMYSVYRSLEIEYGYSNYFDIVEAFHNAYNRYRDIMVSAYGESGQQHDSMAFLFELSERILKVDPKLFEDEEYEDEDFDNNIDQFFKHLENLL